MLVRRSVKRHLSSFGQGGRHAHLSRQHRHSARSGGRGCSRARFAIDCRGVGAFACRGQEFVADCQRHPVRATLRGRIPCARSASSCCSAVMSLLRACMARPQVEPPTPDRVRQGAAKQLRSSRCGVAGDRRHAPTGTSRQAKPQVLAGTCNLPCREGTMDVAAQ